MGISEKKGAFLITLVLALYVIACAILINNVAYGTDTASPESSTTGTMIGTSGNAANISLNKVTYTTEAMEIAFGETTGTLQYQLMKVGATPSEDAWQEVVGNKVTIDTEGSYDFIYRVLDTATNQATVSSTYTIYYDTKRPNQPTLTSTINKEQQCLEVTLAVKEDGGSPISKIMYKIGDGEYKEYTGAIQIRTEGRFSITSYAIDACGNEGNKTEKKVDLIYSDLMALPTVKAFDNTPNKNQVRYKLATYNSKYTYSYQFVQKGKSVSSTSWKKLNPKDYITIAEDGIWYLYIKVDYNGNSINDAVATCQIDKVVPEVYAVSRLTQGLGENTVVLTVNSDDKVSGDTIYYSWDKGLTWSKDNSKTYSESTILKVGDIRVRDAYGNMAYAPWAYQITITDSTSEYEQIQAYYTKAGMDINDTAVNDGYVSGLGDGNFGPDNKITRAQLATILNNIVTFTDTSESNISYSDVADNFWAHDYIVNVQRYEMINTSSKNFYPNMVITRGELAHAICQFVDLDGINPGEHGLTDISNSEYKDDIIRVYTTGLMSGYGDGRFGTNDELTRAQVVTVLNKIISISDKAKSTGKVFGDVPKTHWAYEEILKASH